MKYIIFFSLIGKFLRSQSPIDPQGFPRQTSGGDKTICPGPHVSRRPTESFKCWRALLRTSLINIRLNRFVGLVFDGDPKIVIMISVCLHILHFEYTSSRKSSLNKIIGMGKL